MADSDFDRLANIVTAMIDGIGESFLGSLVCKVEKTLSLSPSRMLDHALDQEPGANELERLAQHAVERSAENLFLEPVASRSFGEVNDVYLGLRKEAMRFLVEKEQPDVAGKEGLGRTVHDLHLAAERLEIHLGRGAVEVTADRPEEGADESEIEVCKSSLLVDTLSPICRG